MVNAQGMKLPDTRRMRLPPSQADLGAEQGGAARRLLAVGEGTALGPDCRSWRFSKMTELRRPALCPAPLPFTLWC